MQTILGGHWHHLPADEVLQLLDSDAKRGLDIFEIQHRRERFGPNALTPRWGRSPFVRFLLQFNNPLIYILLTASIITAVLKDVTDALIIFLAVLINAVIGFIQEARAEKAIEALTQRMSAEATVVRAGRTQRVPAADLVPGDIVGIRPKKDQALNELFAPRHEELVIDLTEMPPRASDSRVPPIRAQSAYRYDH